MPRARSRREVAAPPASTRLAIRPLVTPRVQEATGQRRAPGLGRS
jgi:hypothetical protein